MKKAGTVFLLSFMILTGLIVFYLIFKFIRQSKNIDQYLGGMNEEKVQKRISEVKEKIRERVEEEKMKMFDDMNGEPKPVRRSAPVEKAPKKVIVRSAAVKDIVRQPGLNNRQNAILDIIKDKRKMNMTELAASFKDVTQRTLRRDMGTLEAKGIVKQVGRTRDSFYELTRL